MTPGGRGARAHRRRRCPTGLRGRHTLAVLGAAGLLAGGYALATTQVEVTGAPVAAPPLSAPPVPAGIVDGRTQVWAQRASVALVSVNRQLDTLAHAEQEWTRLPESRRLGRPPALAALAERRSILQRRQATLQSQLDAYRALQESRRDLAVSEQHLATLETALVDVPPVPRRSAEQAAAVAALDEQRDLRVRQRDAQRTEVESLEEGVAAATALPLPDDAATTERVSNDVLAVVRDDGDAPDDPDEGELRLPQIVPGREQDDVRPRQEAESSGPPDPRGPRHGGEDRNAAKDRDGKDRDGKGRDEKAGAGHADARVTQSPDEQAEDERGDDNRGDDNRGDDNRGDDNRGDDNRGDDKRADDKRADDKRADDHRADDKRADDHRADDHRDEDRARYDREPEDVTTDRTEPARIVLRLVPAGRVAAAPVEETRAASIGSGDRIPGGSSQQAAEKTAEKTSAGEKPEKEKAKKEKAEKKKAEKKKAEKKSGKKSGDTTSSKKKSSEKKSGESSDDKSSADDTSDD